jgi:small GTP-binding protein
MDISEQNRLVEQIESIQKEIRETPYHKGTEHYIGRLRARIARLKDKEIESESRKGAGGKGYAVKHQGDATLVLIGPPSVGKSTLINKLTNTNSKIAPYEFTTVSVIPGMMIYKNARIQVLDVPGLIHGAEEGKGRGREVLSVARGSDLLVIMAEVGKIDSLESITKALERNGIRINCEKPNVLIEKKLSGGTIVRSNIRQEFNTKTVEEIAQEFGIKNAEITIKEKLSLDRLIDSFSPNRAYLPALFVINKIDLQDDQSRIHELIHEYRYSCISAEKEIGIKKLKEEIWNKLRLLTVYLVHPDKEPDTNNPIIMKIGQTLEDTMDKLGSDFSENKTKAVIWGNGSKFPGQEISLSTKLQDGMQVRFVLTDCPKLSKFYPFLEIK